MNRYLLALGLTALVACSGTEKLSSAPTDKVGAHAGPDTTIVTNPPTPSVPAPVLASFALSGLITGHDVGVDTSKVTPLPNAKVTLVKVASVDGDTLNPSVTVTSATTDAAGKFRLENVPSAYYRIDVTAPEGSPFLNGTGGVGPARESEVAVSIALRRKP